ncbi:MAG: hypothetical protein JNN13_09540, partial [Planctomycetes bacterium]|nr:hypothetical protein [Planctomycetota bacterium]
MLRSRSWLVLPLLVALAALVWWPGEAEAPPPVDALAEAVMDGADAGLGDAEQLTTTTADDDRNPAADLDPGDSALLRDDILPAAPGPEGPRVLVARGEPPLPVAGAAVFFVTEADARQRQQQQRLAL